MGSVSRPCCRFPCRFNFPTPFIVLGRLARRPATIGGYANSGPLRVYERLAPPRWPIRQVTRRRRRGRHLNTKFEGAVRTSTCAAALEALGLLRPGVFIRASWTRMKTGSLAAFDVTFVPLLTSSIPSSQKCHVELISARPVWHIRTCVHDRDVQV